MILLFADDCKLAKCIINDNNNNNNVLFMAHFLTLYQRGSAKTNSYEVFRLNAILYKCRLRLVFKIVNEFESLDRQRETVQYR